MRGGPFGGPITFRGATVRERVGRRSGRLNRERRTRSLAVAAPKREGVTRLLTRAPRQKRNYGGKD